MPAFYRLLASLLCLPSLCFAQYNPAVTAKAAPVCEGQPIYLYANWTPPPAGTTVTFSWRGPNNFTSSSLTPSVPYSAAALSGPYNLTVAYSGTNNGFATGSVTPALGTPGVSAMGRVASSTYWSDRLTVCPPTSLSLSIDNQGHPASTTYSWSGPNGFTSPAPNAVVTGSPVPTGTYILTATYPGTCGTAKDTVTLSQLGPVWLSIVQNTPNGTPGNEFCPNTQAVLTAYPFSNTTEPISYSWTDGSGNVLSNGASCTITVPAQAGSSAFFFARAATACTSPTQNQTRVWAMQPYASAVGRVNAAAAYENDVATCTATSYSLSVANTASLITAYAWSGPANFASAAAVPVVTGSPVPPGTYTAVVTYEGGCSARGTTRLRYEEPVVGIRTPPSNSRYLTRHCPNTPLSFTAIVSPTAGPMTVSYVWEGPTGLISTDQVLTIANPTNRSQYKVTATYSGVCSGTAVSWLPLSIGPPEVGAQGSTNLTTFARAITESCSVTALQLSADLVSPTDVTYVWAGPNGFSSSAPNPTLTGSPVPSGIYSLTTLHPNGCGTSVSAYTLTYRPPTLSILANDSYRYGGARFCPNSTVTLTPITNDPVVSYTWRGPAGVIGTMSSVTVTNTDATTYSLTAAFSPGCSSTLTTDYTLTAGFPPVTINVERVRGTYYNGSACPGASIRLRAVAGAATQSLTYRWRGPNGFTSQASDVLLQTLTPSMAGLYSVTITSSGSCVGYGVGFFDLAVKTPRNPIYQYASFGYNMGARGSLTDQSALCEGGLLYLNVGMSDRLVNSAGETISTNTFRWEGPNGIASSWAELRVNNVTSADAGRYILTTHLGAGCADAIVKDTTYIVVGPPAPTLRASQAVVPTGASVTLYADNCLAFRGYGVVWSDGSIGKKIVVTPTQTTTYRATCTLNQCVSSPSEPLTIVVLNTPPTDIALRMRTDKRVAKLGEPISATITVVNEGTATAAGLRVLSRLPASVGVLSPGTMQAVAGGVQGTMASLAAGATQDMTFTITQQTPGTNRIAAQLTGAENPDADSWPNSGTNDGQDDVAWVDLRTDSPGTFSESPEPMPTALPAVEQAPFSLPDGFVDLGLQMRLSHHTLSVGETVSVTLTLTNTLSRWLLTPSLRCTLPVGVVYLGGTGTSVNGQDVLIAGGEVLTGANRSYTFQAQVTQAGPKTLLAEIQQCDWPDTDSLPGNGYTNGEDDTVGADLRVR